MDNLSELELETHFARTSAAIKVGFTMTNWPRFIT